MGHKQNGINRLSTFVKPSIRTQRYELKHHQLIMEQAEACSTLLSRL